MFWQSILAKCFAYRNCQNSKNLFMEKASKKVAPGAESSYFRTQLSCLTMNVIYKKTFVRKLPLPAVIFVYYNFYVPTY